MSTLVQVSLLETLKWLRMHVAHMENDSCMGYLFSQHALIYKHVLSRGTVGGPEQSRIA
jgi:DNA repair protein RadC